MISSLFLAAILSMRIVVYRQVRRNVKDQIELVNLRDELTDTNNALQMLALVDSLTGLANRRQFELSLETLLKHAAVSGEPVTLIMFDVDNFKAFNDTYGHVVGDRCLRQVSEALCTLSLPDGAAIARYGGEEFAMILPGVGPNAGLVVAQNAVENIRGVEYSACGRWRNIRGDVKCRLPLSAK